MKRLAVDFDGVLNSNVTGYHEGRITDLPVDGAVLWMWDIIHHFDVVVFSCRAATIEGYDQISTWMEEHGFPCVEIHHEKPEAHVYIDDRGFRFEGRFPTPDELNSLKRWNKDE